MRSGRNEHRPRILIVDDDPDSLFLTHNLLINRVEPCEFVTCNSAEVALQLFDKGQAFDVIVTDQTMARMDGVSLVRALRARTITAPIIVTSLRPDIREQALAAGATYFVDPSHRDELAATVLRALSELSHPGSLPCRERRRTEGD